MPKTVTKDDNYKQIIFTKKQQLDGTQGNGLWNKWTKLSDILMPGNFQIKKNPYYKIIYCRNLLIGYLLGQADVNDYFREGTGSEALMGDSEASPCEEESGVGMVWDACVSSGTFHPECFLYLSKAALTFPKLVIL